MKKCNDVENLQNAWGILKRSKFDFEVLEVNYESLKLIFIWIICLILIFYIAN